MIFSERQCALIEALDWWRRAPRGGPGARHAASAVNTAYHDLLDLECSVAFWVGTRAQSAERES